MKRLGTIKAPVIAYTPLLALMQWVDNAGWTKVGAPIRQNNLATRIIAFDASIARKTKEPGRSLPTRPFPSITQPNVMSSRRQPLMETSDNNATSSPAPTSTARRSGRVSKAPAKFTPDAPAATKRKRNADPTDEDAENESPDEVDEPSDDNDDDTDDNAAEEPRRAPKKKKPSSQASKPRKPAVKKPKINGDAPGHEPIHAAQLPSRPKKAVRIAIARPDGDGLYGAWPPGLIIHGFC